MPTADFVKREILNPHARHAHAHRHARSHIHSHEARDIHAVPALFHEINIESRAEGAIDHVSRSLNARGNDSDDDGSDHLINLLLIVLGIVFLSLILVSALFLLRRQRLQKAQEGQAEKGDALPTYQDASKTGPSPKGRGLTIETKHHGQSNVVYIGHDGKPMLQNPDSPPHSPDNVPEIRITFPEEQDEQGRPRSGRVVVVRVGDNSALGLEPLNEEQLPAYENDTKGEFQSIDMDQIGGLKEKDSALFK